MCCAERDRPMAAKKQDALPVFDVDRKMGPRADVRVEINQSRFDLAVPRDLRLMKTPQGELTSPSIMWKGTQHGGQWGEQEKVEGCLEEFLSLAAASDEDIFEFVRRYGVIQRSVSEYHHRRIGTVDLIFSHRPDSDFSEFSPEVRQWQEEREAANEKKMRAEAQKWLNEPGWLEDYVTEQRLQRQAPAGDENSFSETASYSPAFIQYSLGEMYLRYLADTPETKWFFQPPEIYRRLSKQANAILRIGASLFGPMEWEGTERAPRCASPEDWQTAIRPRDPSSIQRGMGLDVIWSDDVAAQRAHLVEWVTQEWLDHATITPVLLWGTDDGAGPALNIRRDAAAITRAGWSKDAGAGPVLKVQAEAAGGSVAFGADDLSQARKSLQAYALSHRPTGDRYALFTHLALQLVQALTSPQGIHFCDECKRVYNPAFKLPRTGIPNYCSDICSKTVRRRTEARSRKKRSQEATP